MYRGRPKPLVESFFETSQTGSRIIPVYESRYDDHGNLVVEQVGEDDLYLEIQSHKDSCSIENILRRYTDGDTSVLDKPKFFGDDSVIPSNPAQVMNEFIETERWFLAQPTEFKEQFGNSAMRFICESRLNDFVVKDSNLDASFPVQVEKEVVSDES